MAEDHYKILGIPADADEGNIRSAHRRLAKQYHPDTGPGASEEKFRAVQNAYDVLSDPTRREAYDRSRRPQATQVRIVRAEPIQAHARSEHVDLRYLSRPGARPEPIPWEQRFRRSESLETELFHDMLTLLRFFDDF
jgi:curved DNA-binding protein CbpA